MIEMTPESRLVLTKATMSILDSWKLNSDQMRTILGLSDKVRSRGFQKFRSHEPFPLSSRTQETSPSNIALAYIDCDLYSSTKDVHAFLAPRLKHGQVIAYDDDSCYSATQPSGERAAHQELDQAQPQWRFVPYARFGWAGQAFVVESAT